MNKLIIFFSFSFILSCNNLYKPVYVITPEQRISLQRNYKINGLYSHIPEFAKESTHGSASSLPIDTLNCDYINQSLYAIIIGNKKDYLQDFKKTVDSGIVYKTVYFNSDNFIIDIRELKNKLFHINKCNKFRKNKMPIPYFEGYDFGLGEKKTLEKQLEGEPRPRYRTIYNVPKDLKVYVIDAKAGNFWTFDCKENRPKALKQWQHGYSKGVAISDKDDKVVFWVMIW